MTNLSVLEICTRWTGRYKFLANTACLAMGSTGKTGRSRLPPTPVRRVLPTRESPYHPLQAMLLHKECTFFLVLVDPVILSARVVARRCAV